MLEEIDAQDIPRIRVFNKIDHVGDAKAQAECEAALRARYPDCIVMSARRPDEVAKLRQTIVAFFQRDLVEAELLLPWSAQQLRKEIYANCEVLEERAEDKGAVFRLRGESEALERLRNRLLMVI
ncbi:conserved hypothetical GTP binding protein [Azoarcus olearius]|uniref:Conserved hypothetical GTP binding protein n=1 Tax=Azoarcus sp. (strain BH72) TaxID=418699 RepID=A1K536_AZOSB|nr:conserved hypothetical GTP binding protein [Azoarcus olearius]